jgi:hypothetical protein
MKTTFTCHHCGEEKDRNPRIKSGQQYCGASDCHKARRRNWKLQKYATDSSYREQCLLHNRLWRQNHPSHEYQRSYRFTHPEYTERNRELQRKRNQKRCDSLRLVDLEQKIVNGNTLSSKPARAGLYVYMPAKFQKIVNGNTLLITMRIHEGEGSTYGLKWL